MALPIALAACSAGPPASVLNGLVGHSTADVVQALGVPNRSYSTEGRQFLAYDRYLNVTIPGSGPHPARYPLSLTPGAGFGYAPEVIRQPCETTLEVEGNRVAAWTQRGPGCG